MLSFDEDEKTFEEIASDLDISRQGAHQLYLSALRKVRHAYMRGDRDAIRFVEWLFVRSAIKSTETHWDRATLNSPGSYGLAGWARANKDRFNAPGLSRMRLAGFRGGKNAAKGRAA